MTKMALLSPSSSRVQTIDSASSAAPTFLPLFDCMSHLPKITCIIKMGNTLAVQEKQLEENNHKQAFVVLPTRDPAPTPQRVMCFSLHNLYSYPWDNGIQASGDTNTQRHE